MRREVQKPLPYAVVKLSRFTVKPVLLGFVTSPPG
jgi:hypothetical protein